MMINLLMKFSGFGFIWGKLDGIKTYLAAACAILTGLSGMCIALVGLLGEIMPMISAHDGGALYAFAKSIKSDDNAANLATSWIVFVGGLGLLGLGHKADKANAQPTQTPQAPAA